jgi:hypothetical protein
MVIEKLFSYLNQPEVLMNHPSGWIHFLPDVQGA